MLLWQSCMVKSPFVMKIKYMDVSVTLSTHFDLLIYINKLSLFRPFFFGAKNMIESLVPYIKNYNNRFPIHFTQNIMRIGIHCHVLLEMI